MTTETTDIRREMVLRAPKASVWNAITTAEGWTGWFSEAVEGKFEVGHTLTLDFGKHGKCWARVVERTEKESFAYRWHPGEDCAIDKYPEAEMTTVRFTLADHPDGTLLLLTESGFENLPEERRANAMRLNNEGWDFELAELATLVVDGKRQATGA